MNRNPESPKNRLDRIAAGIRNETIDPGVEAAAAKRVRESLGLPQDAPAPTGRIERCEGFRARIPALLAGSLPKAEALLVEDHTRSCVPCRRALIEARAGARPERVAVSAESRWSRNTRRFAAAAAVIVLVIAGWLAGDAIFDHVDPLSLSVVEADHGLWKMDGAVTAALRSGDSVREDLPIRTERAGGAVVRLADGSRVELREGSEMRVSRSRDGATIHLARGSVIVEAAPQGRGRLRVATGDALATVHGTVFTVHSGLGGSRVSVLEGAVGVSVAGNERSLGPGEQIATGSARPVPLGDEVAWSVDPARYEAFLADIEALRADLRETVRGPAPRTGSRLLGLVPSDTVVYFAMPNLSDALDQAVSVFQRHLDRSESLREWWASRVGSAEAEREMEQALARIREVGAVLGDEIVVAFLAGPDGQVRAPVVLAEIRDEPGLRAILERERAKVGADLTVRVEGDLAVAGPPDAVAGFRPVPTPADATPFRARLASVYADGAGWVFGIDLASLGAAEGRPAPSALLGVAQVIADRTEVDGRMRSNGTLFLTGAGEGLAGWLGEPGPMTGLAYVSPEATLAASVLVRSPREALGELFERLGADSPEFWQEIARFREKTGLDPLEDIARPLGQEFAVALDGPALPVPSWKLALEVYDPAAVQRALDVLVERFNAEAAEDGEAVRLRTSEESVAGTTFRTITADGSPVTVWYVFDRGYLVAGPNRAVVEDALARRASGAHLVSSPRFRRALSMADRSEFTGILWERLAGLRDVVPLPAAKSLFAGDGRGRLLTVWASPDRIEFSMDEDGTLGSDLGNLFSMALAGATAHDAEGPATP